MILPVHLEGETIRDAENRVIVSAINPCNMEERRMIVESLNNFIGGGSHGKSRNGEASTALQAGDAKIPSVKGETAKTANNPRHNPVPLPPEAVPPASADGVDCVEANIEMSTYIMPAPIEQDSKDLLF